MKRRERPSGYGGSHGRGRCIRACRRSYRKRRERPSGYGGSRGQGSRIRACRRSYRKGRELLAFPAHVRATPRRRTDACPSSASR